MPRKKKQPQKNKSTEEVDSSCPAKKSKKVSRVDDSNDGIIVSVHYSPKKQPYNLGSFEINSINNEILLPPEFSIKFKPDGASFILLNQNSTSNAVPSTSQIDDYIGSCEIPYDILQLLTSLKQLFYFYIHSSKVIGACSVDIYFDSSKFISLKEASDPVSSRFKSSMYRILHYFLGLKFDVYDNDYLYEEDQIEKIYSCIQNSYNPESSSEFSHEAFIPKLRPYQCQAVSWMLEQEKENSNKILESDLHQLYMAITLQDGHTLYFHKYGGFFVNQKYAPDSPCRGGLLADEMGLGKTLEVLACILMNPRNSIETQNNDQIVKNGILSDKNHNIERRNIEEILVEDDGELCGIEYEQDDPASFGCNCGNFGKCLQTVRCRKCKIIQHPQCMLYMPWGIRSDTYICPFCLEKVILPSRGTLIISPASILHQWKEEISNHIKENCLKVFMYEGVEHQKYVHPKILSNYDIVLVSYQTLKKELSHVNIPYGGAGHSLRNTKRYLSIPSPLCSIEWWRICLDEAQMVENVTSQVAKMVGKLHSVIRWCISGTPIKKSVEDLYGLFQFLDVKPFHIKMWWDEAIIKSFVSGSVELLSSAFNSIAWATMKHQVFNQVGLSEVKEVMETLKFSPVERVYYDKKHSACLGLFMENINKLGTLDINLRYMDKRVLNQILFPMKILQQVCCHFQITQENVDINEKMMSTAELLGKLIKNAAYEAEQIHRQYIMARNGLAGIYVIEQDYISAVKIFEKTLQSIEDNKEHIRTDATQQIHCLFHLSNVLKYSEKEGKIVESKYKPSELDEKVNELTESYFEKSRIALSACKKDFKSIQTSISLDFKDLRLKRDPFPMSSWWCVVLEQLTAVEHRFLLEKLPEVLETATSGSTFQKDLIFKRSLLQYSVPAFHDLLLRWSNELHSERKKLLDIIEDLSQEPDDLTLQSAISCHLRPVENSPKCKYCKAEDVFKNYESKLYVIEETTTMKHCEDNSTKDIITRKRKSAGGPLEICLKFVFDFMLWFSNDYRGLLADLRNDGYYELRLIGGLKREFQVLRNIWKKYYDYVSEKDQIEMAKISMKMVPVSQKKPDSSASYCLYPHEVQSNKLQYHSDVFECDSRLKTNLGKLYYLKNLEKAENKDAPFEENCPICRLKIEVAWFVLQCGHCFCVSCTEQLKERYNVASSPRSRQKGFPCPLCRQYNPTASLHYLLAKNEEEEDKIPLKNFYSTKVNAVIRCLLQIQKDEPGAKSLIFSSFTGLLNILEEALTENHVYCDNLCDRKHFQEDLDSFKKNPSVKALLIPLNFGCSGLNITEANHVLLLEPVFDNSLHHQAIGRAHRIGQKEQVIVHRFIIEDSIEESIYAAMSTSASKDKHNRSNLTLMDLKNIFNKDS